MRVLIILSFMLSSTICFGQSIQGIYRNDSYVYLFYGNNYKCYSTQEIKYYDLDTAKKDEKYIETQRAKFKEFYYDSGVFELSIKKKKLKIKSKKEFSTLMYLYTEIKFDFNGFNAKDMELIDTRFSKDTVMLSSYFDSMFNTYFKKKYYSADDIPIYKFKAPKLQLTNTCNGKVKTHKQKGGIIITRIFVDTFYNGKIDTITQEINGYITAINDTSVSVISNYYSLNNHYNQQYEYLHWKDVRAINISIDENRDTLITFPLKQLYTIDFNRSSSTISGYLIFGSLISEFAAPFYAIHYKKNTFNMPLFKTVSFANLGLFITGIIVNIAETPKTKLTKQLPNYSAYWKIKIVE